MRIALEDSSRMGLELEGLALAKKFYSIAERNDFENDGTQALMKILRSQPIGKYRCYKRRFSKS